MDRAQYNTCMIPYITGTKEPEQRKLDFCIGAKVCSGKASNDEEARKICLSMPPKESKPRKSRGSKGCDFNSIAQCAAPKIIQLLGDNVEITPILLTELFISCSGKTATTLTREKFIKQCFKKNSSNGTTQIDVKEAARLRTFCSAEYTKLTGAIGQTNIK